jgi:hypothetical protein
LPWGWRRRSACEWSPTGGSRGCGNESIARPASSASRPLSFCD